MFSGPGCGDYPHHLNGFSGAGSGEFVFGDTPVAAPSSSGHPRPASDYPSSSGGGAATPPTSVMLGSGPAWYHHHHHEDRDEVGANQQFESEHFFHEMGFEIAVPCTHEMRTMHLIQEQVGCTVHVKKGRRKRKKKGPKLLRCSFFIFGHLFNKFCLCWPAHVLFSARIW